MATKSPARNYYQIEHEYSLWWEVGVGGNIFPRTNHLVVALDGQPASSEVSRAAIQFNTSVPSWVSLGTVTEKDPILWLYIDPKNKDSGSGIELAQINAAWDINSTQAHMASIATGAWFGIFTESNRMEGWAAFDLTGRTGTWLRNTNGIMIRSYNDGMSSHRKVYHFRKSPAPMCRAYYQYPLTGAIPGDATVRTDLTDDQKSWMGKKSTMWAVSGKVKQASKLPNNPDIDITIGGKSKLNLSNRKMQWPESWKLSKGGRGTVSLSKSGLNLADYRGYLLQATLSMRNAQKPSVTVMEDLAIIGRTTKTLSDQTATLEDSLKQILSQKPYYRDAIAGFESVEWTGTTSIFVLADALINGGGINWERFRFGDYYWLMKRFGAVWDPVTYTITETIASTIASIVEDMGKQYGIIITRGNNGEILMAHPAAYRPSMKVHTLEASEMSNTSLAEESTNGIYNKINVTYPTYDRSFHGLGDLQITQDIVDHTYEVGTAKAMGVLAEAGYALCRQLSQRLCGRKLTLDTTIGAKGFDWEIGDQIVVTNPDFDLSADAFILADIKGDNASGKNQVQMLRYPDSPGLHSLFQGSDLQGIWRWQEKSSNAVWTGANMSWEGSAGAFTKDGTADFLNIDWRGPLVGYTASGNPDQALTAPSPFFPTDVADTTDVLDFVAGVYDHQPTDPPAPWTDKNFVHLCHIRKAGTNEAVIVGIYRPEINPGAGSYRSAVENKFFIGHTLNWTTNPIVWTTIAYSPPGVASKYTGTQDDGWMNYGLAVKWRNLVLGLYVNQELQCSLSLSKTGYDEVFFMTPVPDEHRIGCVRWLKSTEDIDSTRLLGHNGVDEFYP